jgi:hypothetical protein
MLRREERELIERIDIHLQLARPTLLSVYSNDIRGLLDIIRRLDAEDSKRLRDWGPG